MATVSPAGSPVLPSTTHRRTPHINIDTKSTYPGVQSTAQHRQGLGYRSDVSGHLGTQRQLESSESTPLSAQLHRPALAPAPPARPMRDDDPSPIPCFLPTGIAYKSSSSHHLQYQVTTPPPSTRGKTDHSNAATTASASASASSSSSSESLDYFGSYSNSPRPSSFSSTHSFHSPSLSPSDSISNIPNMVLRRFAQRQADLLHEQRPNLHVVVVASPPNDGALQLDGTRDYNGERRIDGELVAYENIFFASAFTDDIVFGVYLFEQGRLTLDKVNDVYAFASLSWEKFGPYIFFDPMSPI